MSESIEPASAELEGLYQSARTAVGPSAAQAQRLVSRLDASIAMMAPAAAGAVSAGAAVSSASGLLRRLVPYVLTFTAGLGVGGATVRAMVEPERHTGEPVVTVPVPSAPVTAPVEPDPQQLAPEEGTPAKAVVAPVLRPPRATPKPSGGEAVSTLDEERTLLEPARAAMARGNAQYCLEVLAAHETRFPQGALSEERETLAIQALVAQGQGPAARTRAALFTAKYPDSMLLPVVDATLKTIP